MTYSWHFNRMRPSYKWREPIQGEFFATEAISDPGEALIREGIQNSLDARCGDQKVVVRIRVSGTKAAAKRDTIAPYLSGLEQHLKAQGNGLRDIPESAEDCPFLLFEDFGTTGLTGNPSEFDPEEGTPNHFFNFFRAEGRSDKSEKDRGRWGIGKQVFLRASQINTLFGVTVRSDDTRKLLMGMSVMKSHKVDGARYAPDGWLARTSENGDDILTLPIEDSAFLDSFCRTFDIQRGEQPGLTIVVPWYDLEFTDENILRAILRGYFWPILRGQLDVIVQTDGVQTLLDRSSLDKEIEKIGSDLGREMLPVVELAKWAMSLDDSSFVRLSSPPADKAWQWSKDLLPLDSLSDLRDKFERGEKMAFRVPLVVREKNRKPRETHLDVFLYRDGSEQTGRPVFIRGGIIIPDVRAPRSRGVRSIVVADDGPIAGFLGDSENPAHTQWQKEGSNFKGKYSSGASDLQFVIRSVNEIVSILSNEEEIKRHSVWVNLFSNPATVLVEVINTRTKKKTKKSGPEPETPTPPEPRHKPFIIEGIEYGFSVRNGDTKDLTSRVLLIRAAYQVRHGNPFNKYHTADFDLSQRMKTQLAGAVVLEKKENRLLVRIKEKDFRIEVMGFDPQRDVRVEVKEKEDSNAGSNA